MRTGDLSKQFGVNPRTIQNWVTEFATYLSEEARRTDVRHSAFTQQDYLVLATIAELSQREKLAYKDIHEKLKTGYRVEDTTAYTVGYEDGRLVPAAVVEQVIDSAEIRSEMEVLRQERDRLLLSLQRAEERLTTLEERSQERIDKLQDENRELREQIANLRERLGRAEGELDLRRQQSNQNKRGWFGSNS